jgi:hypothetical protein
MREAPFPTNPSMSGLVWALKRVMYSSTLLLPSFIYPRPIFA